MAPKPGPVPEISPLNWTAGWRLTMRESKANVLTAAVARSKKGKLITAVLKESCW